MIDDTTEADRHDRLGLQHRLRPDRMVPHPYRMGGGEHDQPVPVKARADAERGEAYADAPDWYEPRNLGVRGRA